MKLGVCASPYELPLIRELGFDYIEMNFSAITTASEEDFRAMATAVEREGLPAEACNGFFPGDMILHPTATHSPGDILRAVAAYAERGFARMASLGARVAVLGSGKARRIPDGDAPLAERYARAEEQFVRVLSVCGNVAAKHGIRVAVEPLSRAETNFLHTVAEGAALARRVDHPAVGVMVDFFHLAANGDDLTALLAAGDALLHAHVARPGDRGAPTEADMDTLAAWASALSACPSVERVSLECIHRPDFASSVRAARPAMEVFRRIDRQGVTP